MLLRARSEKRWLGRNEGIFLTPIVSMNLKEKAKRIDNSAPPR